MGNLSWGMQFRTCEKFRVFADFKSSLTPEIFHKYKSHTAITSIVASLRSQILRIVIRCTNLIKKSNKKSLLKFLLLFAFAKSRILSYPTNLNQPRKVILQNLARSANPIKSFLLLFCFRKKVESPLPYRLQLTKNGNFVESKKFFATFLLSQKSRIFSYLNQLQLTKRGRGVESTLDSTLDSTIPQNLVRKCRISHEVRKSFCYFWLLPKVESFLPCQPKSTQKGNFADSANPLLPISLDSFHKRAAPRTRSPQLFFKCLAKSCRFSLLGGVPRFSVSSKKSAGGTSAPLIPDFLHHETGEFLVLTHDLKLDSTQSVESKKSFCYFWLLPKVEFSLSHQPQTTKRGNFVESTESHTQNIKNTESALDSTIPQNLIRSASLKKLLLLLAFAKSRIHFTLPTPNNQRFCNSAESRRIYPRFCPFLRQHNENRF